MSAFRIGRVCSVDPENSPVVRRSDAPESGTFPLRTTSALLRGNVHHTLDAESWRVTYTKRAPVKSAYFVTTEAVARVAKIHTMVTESSYLRVKMFEKMGKAARWLGVPKAMLELDPTASEAPLPRKRGRGSRRRI